MKSKIKPLKLDPDEREVVRAFEAGEFETITDPKELSLYKKYAQNTLNKTKNINIRLSLRDVRLLKRRASQTGLPYQTLASSLIRQFNTHKISLSL